MISPEEIDWISHTAKDLIILEEQSEGAAARLLNALLAMYEVQEEDEEHEHF